MRIMSIIVFLAVATASLPSLASPFTYHVPYFLAANDPTKHSFVRIMWRANACHFRSKPDITIRAIDDEGEDYGPVVVPWNTGGNGGCGRTLAFNSRDLERGNHAKGMNRGIGDGTGAWQLFIESSEPLRVMSCIRTTTDGFLTAMNGIVPFYRDSVESMAVLGRVHITFYSVTGVYRVFTFNPAKNINQRSFLRIINPNNVEIGVGVMGRDDRMVELKDTGPYIRIGPKKSIHVTSQQLEQGRPEWINDDLGYHDGRLGGDEGLRAYGPNIGKWRLSIYASSVVDAQSVKPIIVMNMMSTPTGHITNLSSHIEISARDDPPREGFDIRLAFDADVPEVVRSSFHSAAERWPKIIVEGFPDIEYEQFSPGECGNRNTTGASIDDLLIFVRMGRLGGRNGPVGRANVCRKRDTGKFKQRPIAGWVTVNQDSSSDGWATVSPLAKSIFAHEIGHVLGFTDDIMEASGHLRRSPSPHFGGQQARAAFVRQGGGAYQGPSVPLTRDGSHWHDDLSGELMAALVAKNSPISQITVGLLADLGYKVDFDKAEYWFINQF